MPHASRRRPSALIEGADPGMMAGWRPGRRGTTFGDHGPTPIV